jgi:hypothetical protein
MFIRWASWAFPLDEDGRRRWDTLTPGIIYRLYARLHPGSQMMIVDECEDVLVHLANHSEKALDLYEDFVAPRGKVSVLIHGQPPEYDLKIIGVKWN